jgi:uncharacterized protein (TIRG00374 family)
LLIRRKLLLIIQGIVSSALLFYLFTIIEWKRLIILIADIEKVPLFIAPGILMTGFLFSSIRWQNLLDSLKIRQKIKALYKYYLIGLFYSIFLPGIIGGDIIRISICAKETKSSIGLITTSALIERICGVITLFVIGSLLIFTLPANVLLALGDPMTKTLPFLTCLLLFLLVLVYAIFRNFHFKWLIENNKYGLRKKFVQVVNLVIRLPYSVLLHLFFYSALFQASDIIASFAIAKALNIPVSLTLFFAIMPIVYISTILPVSLGGLGVREGTFVYLLSRVGILSSDAVALSFLIYFNRVLIGSFGGILQIFRPINTIHNGINHKKIWL